MALAMTDQLFEARHLTKRYGGQEVVRDLSFHIERGECLGVIGPNGAGKTTTIRMCLGLTAPDTGEIQALGLAMPRDALAIKAQLGVVSQFDTLDPDFSLAENLLVYGRYFGMKDAAIRERISRLIVIDHGRKIAEGRPRDLISQHLEPDVVEAYGTGAIALAESPLKGMAARVEVSGETVFFYTQDAKPLLDAFAREHPKLRTL